MSSYKSDNKWKRQYVQRKTTRTLPNSVRMCDEASKLYVDIVLRWPFHPYDTGGIFELVFRVSLEEKVPSV